MRRILTGIQPTNDLTIGNYFGSLKPLIENLKEDDELFLFVADMHSITMGKFEPDVLRQNKKNIVKNYIAAGLNRPNVHIFYQSDIHEVCSLAHVLTCCSTLGELERMTQFKDKSQKATKQANGTEKIPTGLLTYPILMAADILLYQSDLVIVGSDQKQHLELTRNLAQKLNKTLKDNILKVPEIYISKTTARIMDLQKPEIKMSKSSDDKKGVIFLNDKIENSIKKIKSAKTDSEDKVYFDLVNKHGISNLMSIYSALTDKTFEDITMEFADKQYGSFKTSIANELEYFLNNYQQKYNSITDEQIQLVIDRGTQKIREIAKENLNLIFKKVGFN
ncbi:MAG: tryptophan--tRNA ligase [Ureaplasma sp.]|nr:tryptophan--tRNA ligase [Ureaplasma sp.]